jgi:hypothetical protein
VNHAQVVGNVLWNGARAGLEVQDLAEESGPLLFANNTVLETGTSFLIWNTQKQAKPSPRVALCNNLFFDAMLSDMVAVVVEGGVAAGVALPPQLARSVGQ